ncbi:MAG: hypothetical protein OXI55_04190 [Gammaproteobacteria bacterium]|nr:hypothetical protein [Gammaproteobacteria bacterium]
MATERQRKFVWHGLLTALALAVIIVLYRQGVFDADQGEESGGASNETVAPAEAAPVGAITAPGPPQGEAAGILPSIPPDTAWTEVDVADINPEWVPEYHESVDGALLVAIGDGMRTWNAGDTIALPVPQIGEVFRPVIDDVETQVGTNRSYVGRTLADDAPYSFVITLGEHETFGYVGTPQGSYELVGNTRLAWLMPTANMDQHVDYSKPDYFYLDEDGERIPHDHEH